MHCVGNLGENPAFAGIYYYFCEGEPMSGAAGFTGPQDDGN